MAPLVTFRALTPYVVTGILSALCLALAGCSATPQAADRPGARRAEARCAPATDRPGTQPAVADSPPLSAPTSPTVTLVHDPPEQPAGIDVGQSLYVRWGGSYWPARIIARLDARRVVIHYLGWGAEHDEIAALERLAFEGNKRDGPYRAGDELYVEWRGSYWPAYVKALRGGGLEIRYQGYGSEWDEVVGDERILQLRPHVAPGASHRGLSG